MVNAPRSGETFTSLRAGMDYLDYQGTEDILKKTDLNFDFATWQQCVVGTGQFVYISDFFSLNNKEVAHLCCFPSGTKKVFELHTPVYIVHTWSEQVNQCQKLLQGSQKWNCCRVVSISTMQQILRLVMTVNQVQCCFYSEIIIFLFICRVSRGSWKILKTPTFNMTVNSVCDCSSSSGTHYAALSAMEPHIQRSSAHHLLEPVASTQSLLPLYSLSF